MIDTTAIPTLAFIVGENDEHTEQLRSSCLQLAKLVTAANDTVEKAEELKLKSLGADFIDYDAFQSVRRAADTLLAKLDEAADALGFATDELLDDVAQL